MALVRALKAHDGAGGVRRKGDVYSVSTAQKDELVAAGVAELVTGSDLTTYKSTDREAAAATATTAVATARSALTTAAGTFATAKAAVRTAEANLQTALKTERNAIRAGATDDDTAPAGHTVAFDANSYSKADTAEEVVVTIGNAELRATYALTITSSGGGTPVTRTGTIAGATTELTGIDCSALTAGTMTASLVLTDETGNAASAVTDTATLTA